MATIKEAMDRAARECSVTPPSSWITSTALTTAELKDFLAETVEELQDRVDWANPIAKDTTIPGTGVEEYDLPSDFVRLTRDDLAVYETTGTRRPCFPVATNGAWTNIKTVNSTGGDRFYRQLGDTENGFSLGFWPKPASTDSITVSYVSENWMQASGGTAGTMWTDETDVLLLPRRLIELGVTFRFRRRKGMPYAEILGEYEMRLARAANDSRQIKVVNMTGTRDMRWPFDIPVPDRIPSS